MQKRAKAGRLKGGATTGQHHRQQPRHGPDGRTTAAESRWSGSAVLRRDLSSSTEVGGAHDRDWLRSSADHRATDGRTGAHSSLHSAGLTTRRTQTTQAPRLVLTTLRTSIATGTFGPETSLRGGANWIPWTSLALRLWRVRLSPWTCRRMTRSARTVNSVATVVEKAT